jgi:hypothetical protein
MRPVDLLRLFFLPHYDLLPPGAKLKKSSAASAAESLKSHEVVVSFLLLDQDKDPGRTFKKNFHPDSVLTTSMYGLFH